MKKLSIIGNWKSYKTSQETKDWFEKIALQKDLLRTIQDKEIVLCVPFTLLEVTKQLVSQYDLPLQIGAQDISPFDEGKFTGEINGKQLQEFATHVIIGHSERRKNFGDTDEVVRQKIEKAYANNLTPIVCVSDLTQVQALGNLSHDKQMIIAYEPLFAIGSGTPDTPENAEKTCAEIKKAMPQAIVIYGGSVTSENVHSFTSQETIQGVLPGGASLDPEEFALLIQHA
jgi:triosephosphate isomerase